MLTCPASASACVRVSVRSPLWQLWDTFGMADADMIGYWDARAPVTTSCANVLVTSYVRRGNATLLALGSWETSRTSCELRIDYAAIGFPQSPPRVSAHLPELTALGQPGPVDVPLLKQSQYHPILDIEGGQGALLLLTAVAG